MEKDQRLEQALGQLDNRGNVLGKYYERFKEINTYDVRFNQKSAKIVDLSDIKEPITIIPITDMHLGSKLCNMNKLKAALELINEIPNCYTIFLGDQMETATKVSVGLGVFEEDVELKHQVREVTRLLKPLADSGKILGMLTGNHEMRVAYMTSLNPSELVADALGIDFFEYQGYISLRVGDQIYQIFVHHGAGGGTTPAGKLNAMRALNKVALADIYLSGHTHGKMYDNDMLMMINNETGMVEPMIRHYAVCGSFLEYWGGYGEMKLFSPADTGIMAFTLYPDKKNVEVTR